MSQQLCLLEENEFQKQLILKHSETFFNEPPPKVKKLIRTTINQERSKIFWQKVKEEQAKSNMRQQQADFIVENFLYWDSYRLEYELNRAGASDGEKKFYLSYLYPFARKKRDMFEKLWQIYEE